MCIDVEHEAVDPSRGDDRRETSQKERRPEVAGFATIDGHVARVEHRFAGTEI